MNVEHLKELLNVLFLPTGLLFAQEVEISWYDADSLIAISLFVLVTSMLNSHWYWKGEFHSGPGRK